MNRKGEIGAVPDRQDRIFHAINYWYYTTREGVNIGPFNGPEEAQKGIQHFVDYISHGSEKDPRPFSSYRSI